MINNCAGHVLRVYRGWEGIDAASRVSLCTCHELMRDFIGIWKNGSMAEIRLG